MQWKNPQSPRPSKVQQVQNTTKSVLIGVPPFKVKDIFDRDRVPPSSAVNSDVYCDFLRLFRERDRNSVPTVISYRITTTRPLSLPKTTQFLVENTMAVVQHLPYSPSPPPSRDTQNKTEAEERRFDTVDEIQRESRALLDVLQEKDFRHGFYRCKSC